jgi:hypothetical protein
MNSPYSALEDIRNRYLAGECPGFRNEVIKLLSENDIKRREDDGEQIQINTSIPTTIEDLLVTGLRYSKRDGSPTEDHFLFQKNSQKIKKYYGKGLEQVLPEYKGTHKQPIDFNQRAFTSANTISVPIDSKTQAEDLKAEGHKGRVKAEGQVMHYDICSERIYF